MAKATKEAKVRTSWINPNEAYDTAVAEFVRAILDEGRSAEFLRDFRALQRTVAHYGAFNSLAQTLLKLTVPGVPDTYQGNELWDLSLVDPDNRRPVDYAARERLLEELRRCVDAALGAGQARAAHVFPPLRDLACSLVDAKEDGRIKLYVTWRTLTFRREHAALFREGSYLPLEVAGELAEHVFAFARERDGACLIVAVPRLLARLGASARAGAGRGPAASADAPSGSPQAGSQSPEREAILPLGEIWGATRVMLGAPARGGPPRALSRGTVEVGGRGTHLPEPDGNRTFTNLFTGERLGLEASDDLGPPSLPLARVFADFPVALLYREAP
jgi:maltooligosyltrehalose synthase